MRTSRRGAPHCSNGYDRGVNPTHAKRERFVSEAIEPVVETADTARMASGEPGLPSEFAWRGRSVVVASLIRSWRETGPCRHGSGERYVRKHWYEIATPAGEVMKIYFERQPRRGRVASHWRLFSVQSPDPGAA
jgi:phosphoribosylglycinamide formyltransferase-1